MAQHDGTDLIADLEARNLIHDSTDRDSLRDAVAAGPVAIYYGCDPTADSLHVGNLIGLIMLRRFQDAGHRPIALAGGATGMVGDPSGRSDERNLLDDDVLNHNVAAIKAQLGRIVDLGDGRGELVDNRDWTQPITVLEFLRDVGKHVTVNQMLARESIKLRVNSEHGISFTEFSYMLLQANDYLWLHDNLGCTIQIGGSDQWGNIIAGVDLIRRKRGEHVHAFSWPLLTRIGRVQARQDHRRPRVARPGEDQPVPVPPALDADSRRRGRRPVAHVLAPAGRADPIRRGRARRCTPPAVRPARTRRRDDGTRARGTGCRCCRRSGGSALQWRSDHGVGGGVRHPGRRDPFVDGVRRRSRRRDRGAHTDRAGVLER